MSENANGRMTTSKPKQCLLHGRVRSQQKLLKIQLMKLLKYDQRFATPFSKTSFLQRSRSLLEIPVFPARTRIENFRSLGRIFGFVQTQIVLCNMGKYSSTQLTTAHSSNASNRKNEIDVRKGASNAFHLLVVHQCKLRSQYSHLD
jgi:hypothetical protein